MGNPTEPIDECATLLAKPTRDPLVVQVARVAAEILDRRPDLAPKTAQTVEIAGLFRTFRLIPIEFSLNPDRRKNDRKNKRITDLFAEIGKQISCDNLDAARVCFAASLYPQRSFQLGEILLTARLEAFARFLKTYVASTSTLDTLSSHLAATIREPVLSAKEIKALVDDLAGVGIETHKERKDAFDGAVFYMGTCHTALLQRICRFWKDDGEFVRVFRAFFPSPPSCLSDAVCEKVGVEHWQMATDLEKSCWGVAHKWPMDLRTAVYIQDAWEKLWEAKVLAQFPYYAFRSHFQNWWKQEFGNYRFGPFWDELDENGPHVAKAGSRNDGSFVGDKKGPYAGRLTPGSTATEVQAHLSIDELRIYREGFRLVRSTFVAQKDTQALREALDSLWYLCVDKKLQREDVEWGDLGRLIAELSRKPGLSRPQLLTAYNRLRLKMWAYVQARTTGKSNKEILESPRPRGYDSKGIPQPLKDTKGVETITSLARIVPWDTSLLGAFTANIFLRTVFQLHSVYAHDQWTFKDFVIELWRWISDPCFTRTVQYGGELGLRGDATVWASITVNPLREFISELCSLKNINQVKNFVKVHSLKKEREACLKIVTHLTCPGCFDIKPRAWKAYLQWPDKVGTHWIVPGWYVTVVEQMQTEDAIKKLRVDVDEEDRVRRLLGKLQEYVSARRTIASYLAGERVSRECLSQACDLLRDCDPKAVLSVQKQARGTSSKRTGTILNKE